jgi:hypothetical protein
MIRRFLLLATLATPVALFAQATVPAGPGNNTVVQPGANIYVVGGGLYGTGVYVMPSGGAVAPGPGTGPGPGTEAGISLAGRTGISLDQPLQLGVQSTLAPSWPVTAYAGYNVGSVAGAYGETEAATIEGVAPAAAGVANDFGPSYAAGGEPQVSAASLGEVAAYYKANQQNVRTYTNADAQRLGGTVTVPATQAGGTPEVAQAPAETRPQPTPAPSSENQTLALNAPPPEIAHEAPPATTTETHEGKSALPATSTLLPLLGLLGIASGAIGLWLRSQFLK